MAHTIFELTVRGTEIRHISRDERHGTTQVILPVWRCCGVCYFGTVPIRERSDDQNIKAILPIIFARGM